MSRMNLALLSMAIAATGCAHAVRLELDVPETSAAHVTARLTKGEKAPDPDACDLPCGISIQPSTRNELTVTAPGYYPATFSVAYEQVFASGRGKDARLVVPLLRRPEPPPPPRDMPSPEVPSESEPLPVP